MIFMAIYQHSLAVAKVCNMKTTLTAEHWSDTLLQPGSRLVFHLGAFDYLKRSTIGQFGMSYCEKHRLSDLKWALAGFGPQQFNLHSIR